MNRFPALLLVLSFWATAAPAANDILEFAPSRVETETRRFLLNAGAPINAEVVAAVDGERLAATVLELLAMPSRSCREQAIVTGASALLSDAGGPLGVTVHEDDLPARVAALPAAERTGLYCDNGETAPQAGNVVAHIAGAPHLPSWNLSFHLDTNQVRFDGITRDGDVIRPGAGSPLGADDKAGLAIIAEVLRVIAAHDIEHGDIRLVGLVAEEDSAVGAQLVAGEAFQGDIVVSIDGTDPAEIGRAAPTMYAGYMTVRTRTSHPASVHEKSTVSACAVGARIFAEAGLLPQAHPEDRPDVVFHSYFTSCGVDAGGRTAKGHPVADFQYNTISPFWTAAWQLRSLEGPERAAAMTDELAGTVDRVCENAAMGRTPVECEITGTERADLVGYVVDPEAPSLHLLGVGFVEAGSGPVTVTARQFGGFNGNYINSRFGEEMLIVGTGAEQIHTNEETLSVSGMARVARGILGAMVESYRYRLVTSHK